MDVLAARRRARIEGRLDSEKISTRFGAMQVIPNFKNLAIAIIGAFFLYLIYLLWGAGPPQMPEMLIDLHELINYSILAVERGGIAVQMIHLEKQSGALKSKGKTKEGRDEFVTKADLISNHLIIETLSRLPGLQIISEEKERVDAATADAYSQSNYDLWLASQSVLKGIPDHMVAPLSDVAVWVDPLDATQEYTEDLTEYVTVMICIAVRGRPKFGVIHRPFQRQTVWGLVGHGVFPNATVFTGSQPAKTIVVSRSHAGKVEELAKDTFGRGAYKIEPAGGSGYKTLRVLNGTAAMYLHQTAIKKWDVCAGDAIIRSAGGRMTTLEGSDLTYHPDRLTMLNPKGLLVALKTPFAYLAKLRPNLGIKT